MGYNHITAINGTIKAEVKIMLAVKGTIQGNTVVIKDEDIKKYDGKDVIVTILDFQFEQQKKQVDLKKYMGRGEKLFQSDAQEAIRELRDYDRL